jgi:hypothetical protein
VNLGKQTKIAKSLSLTACMAAVMFCSTCGGGGGSKTATTPPPATPTVSGITPSTLIAGQTGFTLTVEGTQFVSSSVVQWNGASRQTTFVSTIQLKAAILASDIATSGTFPVTVATPGTPQVVSNPVSFTAKQSAALAILTRSLPPSAAGKKYYFVLAGTGGVPPLKWSLAAGSPSLPASLVLHSSSGLLTGFLSGASSNFTVQLTDFKNTSKTRTLSLQVNSSLGRNDNVCPSPGTDTATPISNGTLRASISPYGDVDTYSFTLTKTATNLTVETLSERLNTGSDFLDSVLELLDSDCKLIALNDDLSFDPSHVTDSKIHIGSTPFPTSVTSDPNFNPADKPAPTSLPTGTYYIRVRDYRGDGRPDLIYDLKVSGVN